MKKKIFTLITFLSLCVLSSCNNFNNNEEKNTNTQVVPNTTTIITSEETKEAVDSYDYYQVTTEEYKKALYTMNYDYYNAQVIQLLNDKTVCVTNSSKKLNWIKTTIVSYRNDESNTNEYYSYCIDEDAYLYSRNDEGEIQCTVGSSKNTDISIQVIGYQAEMFEQMKFEENEKAYVINDYHYEVFLDEEKTESVTINYDYLIYKFENKKIIYIEVKQNGIVSKANYKYDSKSADFDVPQDILKYHNENYKKDKS